MSQTLKWSVNLNPARLSPFRQIDELYDRTTPTIEQLQDLGVGFVRLDLRWEWLEPEPGIVDEQMVAWYHHYLTALERAGIAVYAILYNPPAWAQELAVRDLAGFHEAWRRYCRLCAREWSDRVTVWQVWNEPNNYVSHLKDDFNLFHTRSFALGGWRVTLPVGVRWDALVPLFRIARSELDPDAFLAYNVIANVSEFTPVTYPGWTEWDHFTDQFMQRAGGYVDAIALDHYPDTWVPGSGPLHWTPLDVLSQKVHDPRSAWYGKTAIVGEFGYSSCPNVDLVRKPARIRFFPEDHSDQTMHDWYAAAVPCLTDRLDPAKWPHNKLHLANVYELYDANPGEIFGGDHAEVVGIEYHFGLLRANGDPKPAYGFFRDWIKGRIQPQAVAPRKSPTNPLGLYIRGSAVSKTVHRHVSPALYALFQALRPPLRRHDAGILSMGAVMLLYQWWRTATRSAAK
jgi:hypothetical protein